MKIKVPSQEILTTVKGFAIVLVSFETFEEKGLQIQLDCTFLATIQLLNKSSLAATFMAGIYVPMPKR